MKKAFGLMLAVALCSLWAAEASRAAMQIRKRTTEEAPKEAAPSPAPAPAASAPAPAAAPAAEPSSSTPAAAPAGDAGRDASAKVPSPAAKPAPPKEVVLLGSVSFSSGSKVLVELDEAAKPQQRLSVYDTRLRRKGTLVVVKPLDKKAYLARLISGSAGSGDRLGKESEEDAFKRVRRSKSTAALQEFLAVYPDSAFRPKVALELFRQTMRNSFQTFPGSSVTGKMVLTEKAGQEVNLSRALIKLDRFGVALTDENGRFRIEGLPAFPEPVTVALSIRDEKFQPVGLVEVSLPANATAEVQKDVSVKLTPTYLVGRVTDDNGKPVKGAQVWTSPYTMEKLTDENGEYKIWRRKKLDSSGAPLEGDEPLMGRDYEVYAYRQGFGAEKVDVAAQSFLSNEVKPMRLVRQDALSEGLPALEVSLRDNIDLMQYVVSAGAGPKINQ